MLDWLIHDIAWNIAKILMIVVPLMGAVAYLTLAERKVIGYIQMRIGPNRVGPGGLLQPFADGLKNIVKEETYPRRANSIFFVLAPMLSIGPALLTFAVVPFAAPLPTPWGLVDLIIADVSIGMLFILALSSLGVYGLVMAGWSSNSKYAFLGGMRASAQMVSYEIGLGMSLVPVFMLTGDVTLTGAVWVQQEGLGLWFAFPLSVAFVLFILSAFAETNRLPFDMPEAESELVTGYHTEYSSMKFSMFFIAEYAHVLTVSALMATLFLGGWDIPFWQGDNMRVIGPGIVQGAEPAWWKSILTFGAFTAKTLFFVFVFMWVRWTVPRFRYDQIMDLGWKIVLEAITVFILLVGAEILVLDAMGLEFGFLYGLILTVLNFGALALLMFVLDSNRIIGGSARRSVTRRPVGRRIETREKADAEPVMAGTGTPEGKP